VLINELIRSIFENWRMTTEEWQYVNEKYLGYTTTTTTTTTTTAITSFRFFVFSRHTFPETNPG